MEMYWYVSSSPEVKRLYELMDFPVPVGPGSITW